MKRLNELRHTPDGRAFLRESGIFDRPEPFREQLRPPPRADLRDHFGADPSELPVYMGQQVYVDYRRSVLSKIEELHHLEGAPGMFPFCVWMDTDRAGSDKLMTRFRWPNGAAPVTISLAPRGVKDREPRFIALDPERLQRGIDRLATCVFQAERTPQTRGRLNELRALFAGGGDLPLNRFNRRLTDFLLERQMRITLPAIFVSEMVARGWLRAPLETCLNRIPDLIRVFNGTIERLARAGVDPVVRPLPADYLPLFYSCDDDARRLRLRHEIAGGEHYAVASCRCGADYRFYLGASELTLDELAPTGRWSPDLLFPVLINDQVSGVVVGRSSALYSLVLNAVLREVLGQRPVPMLVPPELGQPEEPDPPFDSLIYRYLMTP